MPNNASPALVPLIMTRPRATSEADYVSPVDDDPEVALSELQAEAILNMRLRSLRRLEELELINESDGLRGERDDLIDLLGSEDKRWAKIAEQLRETRKKFGRDSEGGARRTQFAAAAEVALMAVSRREDIAIGRGENRRRTIRYTNALIAERKLATWRGGASAVVVKPSDLAIKGADRFALVVREPAGGAVLAARWLD